MSNLFYVSRSKVSMVTATKKNISLVKGEFEGRPLDYRVMANVVYAKYCLFGSTL